jgi:hypothetical protein
MKKLLIFLECGDNLAKYKTAVYPVILLDNYLLPRKVLGSKAAGFNA